MAETDEIPGLRKVAVLLLALQQDTAAKVLRRMSREMVEDISREIASIDSVHPELRRRVVREFYNLVLARRYVDMGGLAFARTLLQKTLPPEEVRKITASIEHQVQEQPFSFLQKTETENLLTFLASEHPQTIALVLSHLPAGMASEILVGLPTERQIEVITRVASTCHAA